MQHGGKNRTIISVTKLIKLAVESRVTIHREPDSTRAKEVRASQVCYQVVQVSSCPVNTIG